MRKLLACLSLLALSLYSYANNAKYVNMFLGSSGDHGQMPPGAAYPFGMISVCPDSSPHQHGGYDYAVPEISGISINRISGAGCNGSGGNISIKPLLETQQLSIIKGTETAHPGYYATDLSNGIRAELTATVNMALEKYTFRKDCSKIFFIDFSSSFDDRNVKCYYHLISNRTIIGWVEAPTACAKGKYKLYFNLTSDSEFSVLEKNKENLHLCFQNDLKSVEMRIAVSPVDQESADEIQKSNSTYSFEEIHSIAVSAWNKKLNKIKIKGSTLEQKRLFYTFLYRIYLSPMIVSSTDGRYKGTDGIIYSSKDFTYYSSWYIWDTFRTKFPLLCILEPDTMRDICYSLADVYRTGKNNWATQYESVPSVRTEHSVIMLLDSYQRGVTDRSCLSLAYPGMKKEAISLPMHTPDQKLESSYDLWALGKIASILGKTNEARLYSTKSDSLFTAVWTTEFKTISKDFTKMRGNGLYQGSRWQYRFAAPHYFGKMIELTGIDKLNDELEEFFEKNYYNQGNEPDIHTPFLFNRLDAPEKTQRTVRKLLTDDLQIHLYGGNGEYPVPFIGRAFQDKVDGLAPEMDDDDGTMSAWYIFSSIGLYPVVAGENTYEIFSPLYDKTIIQNGKSRIEILTKGRKTYNDMIKRVKVNGVTSDKFCISHEKFQRNCKITIEY